MRSRLIAVIVWACLSTVVVAGDENDGSIDSIARATTRSKEVCPLILTATVTHQTDKYLLRFTLKNTAGRPLTFLRKHLPWGNVDSIQTAAVTAEGALVSGGYPIMDDFGVEKVTVQPNQTLTGSYDLSQRWEDKSIPPTGFPRGKTIVLMWAYTVIAEEIPAKRWPVCTGVTSFKVAG